MRLDVADEETSTLIKLRRTMKAVVADSLWTNDQVRTTKPFSTSRLYHVDGEAYWRGPLKDAVGHMSTAK